MIAPCLYLYNRGGDATIPGAMGELRLVLASRSPRRRELVGLLGFPSEVVAPQVAESIEPFEKPMQAARRLSRRKACSVAGNLARRASEGRSIVLACDTFVLLDGRILGKPADAAGAREMLRALRCRSHTVYTAFTLLEPGGGHCSQGVAATTVVMRDYTDEEIAAYVASGDPLDKAGAYAVQHPTFRPGARLEGCYANVVGLPLCHVARCLEAWGHVVPADLPAACQAHFGQGCQVHGEVLAGTDS
jgi:septum formation protein